MICDDDIVIRYIDLPYTVNGFTALSVDGIYNVYINARLSFGRQQKRKRHEYRHIMRGDFDGTVRVKEIEYDE